MYHIGNFIQMLKIIGLLFLQILANLLNPGQLFLSVIMNIFGKIYCASTQYGSFLKVALCQKVPVDFQIAQICRKLVLKTYIKVQPWILFKKGQKKNCTFQLHFGQIWTKTNYRESPDSTVFAPPGNRTIEKTILFGD